MDGYTAAQIVAAEKPLLEAGVPLMARAAGALADAVRRVWSDEGAALLLVGAGNNGGDVLYAGAELARRGRSVLVLPVASRIHEDGLRAALAAGVELVAAVGSEGDMLIGTVGEVLPRTTIVVDGILGTGSAGHAALRDGGRAVVQTLLEHQLAHQDAGAQFKVVAADLPSGVDPDSGEVPDQTVLTADLTVTFGACKAGLLRGSGPAYAGKVEVADIGLGPNLASVEPAVTSVSG